MLVELLGGKRCISMLYTFSVLLHLFLHLINVSVIWCFSHLIHSICTLYIPTYLEMVSLTRYSDITTIFFLTLLLWSHYLACTTHDHCWFIIYFILFIAASFLFLSHVCNKLCLDCFCFPSFYLLMSYPVVFF